MRILIVEDEEELLMALVRGLKHEGYAVDAAQDGMEGWELASVSLYDVVVLDVNLPGLDGLEVCRRLRTSQPHLLILMLTARAAPQQRIVGLDSGADDYLIKPFHFGELTARLRALLRRDLRVREPLLQYQDLKIDPATKTAWQGAHRLDLTNKEFGILEYLLRHPTEIVTQEALIEHVWDMNANPFTTSPRVHINSLRRKLSDPVDAPVYIQTVIGQGYRLGTPTLMTK